jgi:alkylation response protein AidB-like acyl-CoA dehydrogenase
MNDLAGVVVSSAADASGDVCLARARALIPLLRAAADEIDSANELPVSVLDAMHEAKLFRLLLPRAYGGLELTPVEFISCVQAIAEGDASTAWCMNQ